MQDIDFLPSDFKRRRNSRHGRSWQMIVVCAAIGLLITVAMGQIRALGQVEKRLAQIEPERKVLDARQTQLEELRKQLAEMEARADLIAYMGHPWPKTQLLAATLRSLPDEVVCDSIHIAHESLPGQTQRQRVGDAAEEDVATLGPAVRDMQLLQQECDLAVVTIVLKGTTTDGIELYRYLHRLNEVPLLGKAELQSLESTNDDSNARFQFEARLTVRPGFGQPNGPDGRAPRVAQANATVREPQP